MLQLLDSLKKVQKESRHDFESHIFFDGAVKYSDPTDCVPTDFVLQLVALVQETFGKLLYSLSSLTLIPLLFCCPEECVSF